MQAGEDQIEFLIFDGGGEGFRGVVGIESDESIVFEVDGAVGAFGQGFANGLRDARGPGAEDDHFAARCREDHFQKNFAFQIQLQGLSGIDGFRFG